MKIRKRPVVTNLCLIIIMGMVYAASFGFARTGQGLALKGCTGGNNVALQITVKEDSDIDTYMDTMDEMGVGGTFFFCEQCRKDEDGMIAHVLERGFGVGYYVCARHEGKETDMYIGNGYSVPVMSYDDGSSVRHVGPSIDFEKLKEKENWPQIFKETVAGDMFIRIEADNDIGQFQKVVQIVRDKGYTILKVEEML